MTVQNYAISHFLKIRSYNNLPLNPRNKVLIFIVHLKIDRSHLGLEQGFSHNYFIQSD